jgi:hypothetical protein
LQKLLLPAIEGFSWGFEQLLLDILPDNNPNPEFEGGVSIAEQTDDLISEA